MADDQPKTLDANTAYVLWHKLASDKPDFLAVVNSNYKWEDQNIPEVAELKSKIADAYKAEYEKIDPSQKYIFPPDISDGSGEYDNTDQAAWFHLWPMSKHFPSRGGQELSGRRPPAAKIVDIGGVNVALPSNVSLIYETAGTGEPISTKCKLSEFPDRRIIVEPKHAYVNDVYDEFPFTLACSVSQVDFVSPDGQGPARVVGSAKISAPISAQPIGLDSMVVGMLWTKLASAPKPDYDAFVNANYVYKNTPAGEQKSLSEMMIKLLTSRYEQLHSDQLILRAFARKGHYDQTKKAYVSTTADTQPGFIALGNEYYSSFPFAKDEKAKLPSGFPDKNQIIVHHYEIVYNNPEAIDSIPIKDDDVDRVATTLGQYDPIYEVTSVADSATELPPNPRSKYVQRVLTMRITHVRVISHGNKPVLDFDIPAKSK